MKSRLHGRIRNGTPRFVQLGVPAVMPMSRPASFLFSGDLRNRISRNHLSGGYLVLGARDSCSVEYQEWRQCHGRCLFFFSGDLRNQISRNRVSGGHLVLGARDSCSVLSRERSQCRWWRLSGFVQRIDAINLPKLHLRVSFRNSKYGLVGL